MSTGFGSFDASCPGHGQHEWTSPHTANRHCEHCGTVAVEFFARATQARADFFDTLKAPASAHGSPRKKP
jgi:coenzyme F420-reducing hydrogenase gamma subunit